MIEKINLTNIIVECIIIAYKDIKILIILYSKDVIANEL